MKPKHDVDPEVIRKLEILKSNPVRNSVKAAAGRAAFMEQAVKELQGVSPASVERHNSWMSSIYSKLLMQRKEHASMIKLITTLLIAVSLFVGGSGITVAAAQSSQPDQVLYGVKLLSEDVRQKMAGNPETQYQLAMDFASRRASEIQTMLQSGKVPDDAVMTRYQNQLTQALQYASQLPTDQAIQALQQIQTRLQTQQNALLQVQANGSPTAEAALLRNRQMIMERLQWVQNGLADPAKIKEQLHYQDGASNNEPVVLPTQAMNGNDVGNPWTTGTPTPLSGYGPGPGLSTTSTPEGFFGPGPKPTDVPGYGGNH